MNISDANVSVLKGVGTKMQKELENLGIEDGDTVRMYGLQFDYYK